MTDKELQKLKRTELLEIMLGLQTSFEKKCSEFKVLEDKWFDLHSRFRNLEEEHDELKEKTLDLQSSLEKEREENASLKAQLNEKNITLEKSGSIAEAALKLSGIFDDAQQAADIYLENVRKIYGEQEGIYNETLENAKREAAKIIASANEEAADIKNKADIDLQKRIKAAEDECRHKIIDTNNFCQAKVRELQEKCEAIEATLHHS